MLKGSAPLEVNGKQLFDVLARSYTSALDSELLYSSRGHGRPLHHPATANER